MAGDSHIDMIDMIPSKREVEEMRRKKESNIFKLRYPWNACYYGF
jgi:hypothetical protein